MTVVSGSKVLFNLKSGADVIEGKWMVIIQ